MIWRVIRANSQIGLVRNMIAPYHVLRLELWRSNAKQCSYSICNLSVWYSSRLCSISSGLRTECQFFLEEISYSFPCFCSGLRSTFFHHLQFYFFSEVEAKKVRGWRCWVNEHLGLLILCLALHFPIYFNLASLFNMIFLFESRRDIYFLKDIFIESLMGQSIFIFYSVILGVQVFSSNVTQNIFRIKQKHSREKRKPKKCRLSLFQQLCKVLICLFR